MSNKLEEIRKEINEIDLEMIALFKRRMAASKEVALYKKENNIPIYDPDREISLIENNLSLLNDLELETYYLTFMNGLLTASKDYQKDLLK